MGCDLVAGENHLGLGGDSKDAESRWLGMGSGARSAVELRNVANTSTSDAFWMLLSGDWASADGHRVLLAG